jgi:putative Mn2+ efflux pump MntP
MLVVLLASPFLAVDNFAVAAALGLQGINRVLRAILVMLFGGMAVIATLVGAAAGSISAVWLGPLAQYAGGLILVALGSYQLWQDRHEAGGSGHVAPSPQSLFSLFAVTLGVSLDTLVAGVAFGFVGAPTLASAAVIGAVTALMSLVGVQLGVHLRGWRLLNRRLAPVVLVAVGLAIATGAL